MAGMRRVQRFLNLEQRSGRLSSSRGTSPHCTTNSSQISMDVYQQLMTGDGDDANHQQIDFGLAYLNSGQGVRRNPSTKIVKGKGDFRKTVSSNYDDSLGIESV